MKLSFHVYGKGPPLVILHGLFGLSDNWVTIGRKLGEHFRVYIPDLRNHGHSPHSPVFDFPALEDDLLEFIETHELEKPVLMGHSLGGKTAMHFALHMPGMVGKLIVIDISLRKYPHNEEHQALINAMLDTDLSEAGTRGDVDRQLMRTIESARLRQFVLKNIYWMERGKMGWRLNIKAINENLHAIFEGVNVPGEYIGPSLFIRGGRSMYVSDEDLIVIKKKFPGAVVKTIADATHWVHADAPGEFYRIVSEFLLLRQ
jgi:esterase